jgi:sugar lactone lactonase YvrE
MTKTLESFKLPLAIAAIGMLTFATRAQSFLTNGLPAGVAIGAVSNIVWTGVNGNSIAVDSYNSHDTNHSISGQYPASNPSMIESNANVVSQYGLVNFSNMLIAGSLYLGPNATFNSSGIGVVTGNIYTNSNVQFPDVTLPAGFNNWPIAVSTNTPMASIDKRGRITTNTITAYHFTSSGNYIVSQDLPIVVEANVTVNLNVTSTSWSGSGMYIYGGITNAGPTKAGTAVVYFNGPSSVTISGNAAINPMTRPENLCYYGLPSLTSITYSGLLQFGGVIDAPEANMIWNGGGGSIDISGSVIVNSISDRGHCNFHYDESLTSPQLRIVSQPTNQAVLLSSNATFTVSVTGAAPIWYQWFFNQTNRLAGGTSYSSLTSLTLTNVQNSDSGSYSLIVSNAYNSVTSSVATLTVIILPPAITTQPTNQIVLAGSPAIFGVTASGSQPLSYQWQLNGMNLPGGIITTVAGNGTTNYSGDGGAATNAGLFRPTGVAVDSSCNLFIADSFNNRIRKVSAGGIITTVAGSGPTGYGAGSFSGDGGVATNATLNDPTSVAVDAKGILLIADHMNNCIRKVITNGIIGTVAGGGANNPGNGGAATDAALGYPSGVALDANGNFFFAEDLGSRVRKVTTNGIITIVAGGINNGAPSFSGDGGPATSAGLAYCTSVVVGTSGNLFIADERNNRIRKVSTNGIITTFAGSGPNYFYPGGGSYSGDGGAATNATLNQPIGVALDASGNLFIADTYNQRIREVNASGIITTMAGNGTTNYLGDGGAATNASFHWPTGMALDPGGNLFIADESNNCIRRVSNTQEPVLFLNQVGAADAGNYQLVVTNAGGQAVSFSAALTVVVPPGNQTNYAGSTATFTVQTFGPETLTCQWQKNGSNLFDGGNISGSTSNTLVIAGVSDADAAGYSVVVGDGTNSVTTSNATLTVIDSPIIVTQPLDQSVFAGSDATFFAAAYGASPLVFQWYYNDAPVGPPISGTNVSFYTVTNAQTTDAGSYSVQVMNGYDSATSSNAVLTVNLPVSPTINAQPTNLTVMVGGPAAFSVTADGTAPLSYQWQLNLTNILNATNAIYTIPAVAVSDGGIYSVVVTNLAGSVTSSNALLTVNVPPAVSLQFLNGSPVLNVSGMLNSNFVVQYNTDLTTTNWMDLTSISNLTSSPYQFIDLDSLNQQARFYRVIMR